MHATRSKNGPTPASQLKSGSDDVQAATSIHSQAKGRKRERVDHGSEPIKRERTLKVNDCDSAQFSSESSIKFEISGITEKGGLVNSEGVEKLVQLMQPNIVEKKLELLSRTIFTDVIAATENSDCLSRFIQLKGLPLLDQWLQDIHKGKINDGSPKEIDHSTEEFLFSLLRALDKLPINLQALQMCNIGKSVNYLRTYKNSEIQKNARSLVDIWKKRVEAEMNGIDTKATSNQAVSCASRSRLPEASTKSEAHFSEEKNDSSKPVSEEMRDKLSTLSPGSTKILPLSGSGKDGQQRSVVGSNLDVPSPATRDERSCSSSQSHNNSQSFSSSHTKTTQKEDARSSTARSISVNKVSCGSSRTRRSITCRPVSPPTGSQCETGPTRSYFSHRNLASERLSQSGLTCEKVSDLSSIEGSRHNQLIEDQTIMNSRVSSPVLSGKNNLSDPVSKEKSDVKTSSDVKTESWQSNDFKDILTGSDEVGVSPDDINIIGDDNVKLAENSKVSSCLLGSGRKLGKLQDTSYNTINALVESSVKYAQVNAPIFDGDDCGMNLLASVAAGDMSKVNVHSPNGSSGGTINIMDESVIGNRNGSKPKDGKEIVREHFLQSEDGLRGSVKQGNPLSMVPEQAATEDSHDSLKVDPKRDVNMGPYIYDWSDEAKGIASISTSPICAGGKIMIGHESMQLDEKEDSKTEAIELKASNKVYDVALCAEVKREAFFGVPPNTSLGLVSEKKAHFREDNKDGSYEEQLPSLNVKPNAREECNGLSEDVKLEVEDNANRVGRQDVGQDTSNASSDGHGEMTGDGTDESEESDSSATNEGLEMAHINKKPIFDLNELSSDDGKLGDPVVGTSTFPVSSHILNPLSVPVSPMSSSFPASITVAVAARGPFYLPMDMLKTKSESGWKGSAPTSAFRPAEPRKASGNASKQNRPVFDFDLNVADVEVFDDVASQNSGHQMASTSAQIINLDFPQKKPLVTPLHCSVGFDLDLNQVVEASENVMADFDLNSGPVFDEAVESSDNKHSQWNIQPKPFLAGLRTKFDETRHFSSWLPTNTCSTLTVPPIFSSGGDQPFPVVSANGPPKVLGLPTDLNPLGHLQSFQYPTFPFGTGFSLPPMAVVSGASATYTESLSNGRFGFSTSNSQLLSGPQAVTSQFSRPCVLNPSDGGNITKFGISSKWGRSGLDLNAGPGSLEIEATDASSPLIMKQLSFASPQAPGDEQGGMFQQVTGSHLKRKENNDDSWYRQPSWM